MHAIRVFLFSMYCILYVIEDNHAQTWKWGKTGGGAARDLATDVIFDDVDNMYACGNFTDQAIFSGQTITAAGFNSFVVKYDSSGVLQWILSVPGRLQHISIDPNNPSNLVTGGNFAGSINVGTTPLISAGDFDCYAFKLNNSGNILWATSWGGSSTDSLHDLQYQQSGNWIATGRFNSPVVNFRDNVSINEVYPLSLTAGLNAANLFAAHFRSDNGKVIMAKSTGLHNGGGADYLYYRLEVDMKSKMGLRVLKSNQSIYNSSSSTGNTVIGNSTLPYVFNVVELDSSLQVSRSLVNKNNFTSGSYQYHLEAGNTHLNKDGEYFLNTSYYVFKTSPPAFGPGHEETLTSWNLHSDRQIVPTFGGNFHSCVTCNLFPIKFPIGINNNNIIMRRHIYMPDSMAILPNLSQEPWIKIYSSLLDTSSLMLNDRGNKALLVGGLRPGSTNLNGIPMTSSGGFDAYFAVLEIPSQPLKADAGPDKSFCTGFTGTYLGGSPAATGGTKPPYTYNWSPSTGLNNTSIPYPFANPSSTTTYTLTVTDGNGNVSIDAVTINISSSLPVPQITASGPLSFCTGSVTLSAPAGYNYLWSNGATTQNIVVSTSGTYTVTIFQNSCSATSSPVVVSAGSPPVPVITASGPLTICQGGSLTLTAPPGYASYWWPGINQTTQNVTVTFGGNYVVIVTNAAGCSTPSQPVVVNTSGVSTPIITANGSTTFCQGGSITLTSSTGGTWLWNTGATTQTLFINSSGTYTVTLTNAAGCTATSSPVTVTVNPVPPVPTITVIGPTTFCQGGSTTLSAPPGYTYQWSNGATTQNISVNSSGNYYVTVTSNGCSNTSLPVSVGVNSPPPVPIITVSGSTTFCQGGSVTLSAPAGYTYLWNNGATSQTLNITSSGNYAVTITNANGCSTSSAATTVTVNPSPTVPIVTANGPTSFCQGGSVTLTAPAGLTYVWSNGAASQAINVNTPGNYSVTVTNNNNCSAISVPTTITVTPIPPVPVITQNGNVLTSTPATTYQWYFNGSLIPGATSQTYTYSTGGDYTVTVTNAQGCSATSVIYTAMRNAIVTLDNNERFYFSLFPNPVTTNLTINYTIEQSHRVGIRLINTQERTITIQSPVTRSAGSYTVNANAVVERIWTGVYFLEFTVDGKKVSRTILKL